MPGEGLPTIGGVNRNNKPGSLLLFFFIFLSYSAYIYLYITTMILRLKAKYLAT